MTGVVDGVVVLIEGYGPVESSVAVFARDMYEDLTEIVQYVSPTVVRQSLVER